MQLTEADHDKVSARRSPLPRASPTARSSPWRRRSAIPITTSRCTGRSRSLILVLAWAAWRPDWLQWWYARLLGGWHAEPTLGELLTFLMVLAVLKFTAVLLILK